MSLLDKLQWRYATKKMDSSKSVPQEKVEKILEAIRLTASSSGLQPYELIVITNKDLREKIKGVANNQSQVTDCSHLVVFAAWDNYTAERINAAFDMTETERNFKNDAGVAYRQMLLKNYPARGPEVNFIHTAKQAYIGLGTALIAAAEEGVDSTPMEGFDPKALDEILNLKEKGLRSVVMLPLGYRKEDEDWLVKLKKVRRPKESFISWMN
ncbi:NAD(P)H-dependent oxidoreductase [Polynucleobacter wuianus]|uniref:NAD(P)H-dependent oxidoreductase n=1 Tax=Polynucleobacter wuianus TaxID=1743168 RepID=A0A191UGN4_9BURK|nr:MULTISPECIES: NAD(P)H-dependent oxidoreductase [Polynucleobacter]ANJ00174.1 NAD(P)H-dependent oxidoreductase [Polynucleobacter wuianus]MBU3553483.1 NAD(P)H-dependent oxidoreductase [Polynucleobacter sp. MWH-Post4-6-1]MBU3610305.1 NAD(P)H-dependent oxidoreductase [Polynucleobacter wuianus]